MVVLSLFDGMSCCQIALDKLNAKVDTYYASEIDKHAIRVTMANYPNTIQLGSVVGVNALELPKIDFLAGGSPCQSFSFAGKRKGMSTKDSVQILTLDHYLQLKSEGYEFEGQSYLFWEYMRILGEVRVKNPDVKFLLENVVMEKKWERILTNAIGVEPILINSAFVSAQSRKRLYWSNIGLANIGLFDGEMASIIKQPKDKGILLKDILEKDVDEKYYLSEKALDGIFKHKEAQEEKGFGFGAVIRTESEKSNSLKIGGKGVDDLVKIDKQGNVKSNQDKASCFTAGGHSGGNHSDMDLIVEKNASSDLSNLIQPERSDEAKALRKENMKKGKDYSPYQMKQIKEVDFYKMNTLVTSSAKDNLILQTNFRQDAPTSIDKEKHPCLSSEAGGVTRGIGLLQRDFRIRRLTPTECEALQTVPCNEIVCIFVLCLDQVKNYVSVVEKNPKLLKLVSIAEKKGLKEFVELVIQNTKLYHQQTKYTARQDVDMQTLSQTNQCISHNQEESSIIANTVENTAMFKNQKQEVDFAPVNVLINIIEGRIIHVGMEELHRKDNRYIVQLNGGKPLVLYGKEIMEFAKNADVKMKKNKDTSFIYTTLSALSTSSLDQMLIIYYLFAKSVTIGYTQNTISQNNLYIHFKVSDGYTNHVSSSQRYKMLGNGWNVDTIVHILSYANFETK